MCTTLAGYSASIVRVGSLVARLRHELSLPSGTVRVASFVYADSVTMPAVVNADLVDCHVAYGAVRAGDTTDDQT